MSTDFLQDLRFLAQKHGDQLSPGTEALAVAVGLPPLDKFGNGAMHFARVHTTCSRKSQNCDEQHKSVNIMLTVLTHNEIGMCFSEAGSHCA